MTPRRHEGGRKERDRRRAKERGRQTGAKAKGPFTLAIDVGGSGIKASVLDGEGHMTVDKVRTKTPQPATPEAVVGTFEQLAAQLPGFDRISIGFPGVVRDGRILGAANLDQDSWRDVDLAGSVRDRLGKPVRIMNDADVQGFGVIRGRGVEVIVTLGTGFGFAIFQDGLPGPHLEIGHHPFRRGETYEEQLGEEALERVGRKKWNRRLARAIVALRNLTSFDRLYLGGGNARLVDLELDPDVEVVSNRAGILGGIRLWRES